MTLAHGLGFLLGPYRGTGLGTDATLKDKRAARVMDHVALVASQIK